MTPLISTDLPALYHELNAQFFAASLPPCQLRWSRRLRSSAGLICAQKREITLSVPLLIEAWDEAAHFEVCGVTCDSPHQALREILKHEMIHLWLYIEGHPHGHTPAFRAKARQIGQPKTRHAIALPPPLSGWIYSCAACGHTVTRRRRFRRTLSVACPRCCAQHNGGKYDARFPLRGKKAVPTAPGILDGLKKWPPPRPKRS